MIKPRELGESERAAIAGQSFDEIAKKVGCTKSTAYRIVQKHEKTGSLLQAKRSGRPKALREAKES